MLTMTDNAVFVIREITTQQQAPESAGLRISADPTAGSLTLTVAEQPIAGDQVVDSSGARVFLDAEAANLLQDKSLDAAVDDDGGVRFGIAEQPAG
ncbi:MULTISPECIES: HesB/IscA family protein [Micromonosporaceae]|uniref:HesB/IscA family protein n=1 Tax=Micromonosporaceae TaxID=28056 RepID=UPI000F4830AB|nr:MULTISPECIES: adhesin [Micromonosporaceae]MDG4775055.1 adhesin [Solwaraspora sp. WMMD792]ROO62509.1 Fe-S cluster assembly iron-binding protein IscA [Micromonospora sp. Llam0]WBB95989.1 adhesin [Solwaraspora sp. WMMA2059]WBC20107.1 adhesin [Solwaraspora sp. WMMA2080]WFE23673.1 adhesin [Solwaraspora sp. WMMD937]